MRLAATLAAVALLLLAGCTLGTGHNKPPERDRLTDGESLGNIERLPGGTPVASDVRTFLDVQCANDQLVLHTNLEALVASMPCDRMFPAAITDRFLGQPVVVSYQDNRLKVDNASVGTLEFPADAPRIEPIDATP